MRAGVDWLEAGTPLILAEGMHGVRALRERFRDVPIVADLKTMDGGYLEAEMMAKAGATHVVVMARAHEETIKCVVKAGARLRRQGHGRQPRLPRHGRRGEDARRPRLRLRRSTTSATTSAAASPPRGQRMPSPLDQLREVVKAVNDPGAGGGRADDSSRRCARPSTGRRWSCSGAPLTIDADAFKTAGGDLEASLRLICDAVRAQEVAGEKLS